MTQIIKLFNQIVKMGYTDTDLIYEDNEDIKNACNKILSKYKKIDSWAWGITKELIDYNYLQTNEDRIGCREFIRGYFVGMSEK